MDKLHLNIKSNKNTKNLYNNSNYKYTSNISKKNYIKDDIDIFRYYTHIDIVNTKNNFFLYLVNYNERTENKENSYKNSLELINKNKQEYNAVTIAEENRLIPFNVYDKPNINRVMDRVDATFYSTGNLGFKKSNRSKKHAALALIRKLKQYFKKNRKNMIMLRFVVINVRGVQRNIRQIIRSINNIKEVRVIMLKDSTKVPFGGTRSKKIRRI